MKPYFKTSVVTIVLIIFASSMLIGCNNLDFHITFDKVFGLKKNDAVIFKESVIGKVKKIVYTKEGSFLVHVQIAKDFTNSATQYSKFYIDHSPLKNDEKAVIVIVGKPGGKILESGVIVQGQSKLLATLSELDKIEPFFKTLEEQLNKLLTDFTKIPESDEFKDMKNKLKILSEQLADSSKELQEKIKEELLPKLKEELDKLIKELKNQGEQNKAKSLEDDFKNLQSI